MYQNLYLSCWRRNETIRNHLDFELVVENNLGPTVSTFDYKWTNAILINHAWHHICSHVTTSKLGTIKLGGLL